jgi:hypothetical protein
MGSHIIDGEFQSDKYPTCPRGKVPLSVKDDTAQDLLWEYAQRRRAVDAEFSADLEAALTDAGFHPGPEHGREAEELRLAVEALIERWAERWAGGALTEAIASDLAELLDEVDARDSLTFVERGLRAALSAAVSPAPDLTPPPPPSALRTQTAATSDGELVGEDGPAYEGRPREWYQDGALQLLVRAVVPRGQSAAVYSVLIGATRGAVEMTSARADGLVYPEDILRLLRAAFSAVVPPDNDAEVAG